MYVYWMCCSLQGISDATLPVLAILPSMSVARSLDLYMFFFSRRFDFYLFLES